MKLASRLRAAAASRWRTLTEAKGRVSSPAPGNRPARSNSKTVTGMWNRSRIRSTRWRSCHPELSDARRAISMWSGWNSRMASSNALSGCSSAIRPSTIVSEAMASTCDKTVPNRLSAANRARSVSVASHCSRVVNNWRRPGSPMPWRLPRGQAAAPRRVVGSAAGGDQQSGRRPGGHWKEDTAVGGTEAVPSVGPPTTLMDSVSSAKRNESGAGATAAPISDCLDAAVDGRGTS